MSDDWTAPGAFEVADGVHRIPLPLPNDGLRAVNVYALVEAAGVVLVDAGWDIPGAREVLGAGLATLGAGLGDVSRCLVTHVHRDHYTQAMVLRREGGTTVHLGVDEQPNLDALRRFAAAPYAPFVPHLRALGAPVLAEQVGAFGADPGGEPDWEDPDVWLRDGGTVPVGGRSVDVVATPGHTRGHVVFHDADLGLLFAGDHVLPAITPSVGFEEALSDDPLAAYLRSLAVVRARPDATLLPAHGPVAPSVHRRVDELLAHHDARLERTAAALRAGCETAHEVAGRLTWTRRDRRLDDLDVFNRMLAVSETGAHLDVLVAQERARRTASEGVRRYAPA